MQSGPSNFAFSISLKSLKLFSSATCHISKLTFNFINNHYNSLPNGFPASRIDIFKSILHMDANCCCWGAKLCLILCDPMNCSPPGCSVHGISRHEYWSVLPFPPPGDLPGPCSLPLSHQGNPYGCYYHFMKWKFDQVMFLPKSFYGCS